MTHGSLFSGIGGFDLAAEWMGWKNVFHCEWEEFPRQILKYYWPKAISYGDIKKTDFTIHRGRIDILTGGFPCQPYSTAGKRKGKEDERHLWPEMLRAIREIYPIWVVGENVRGLINWSGGLVFDEVQADLEAAGYEVLPFLLPACGVNAPHRRYRIWFVAHASSNRRIRQRQRFENEKRKPKSRENRELEGRFKGLCLQGNASDTNSIGREGRMHTKGQKETERYISSCHTRPNGRNWQNFPTQPSVCTGNDGISSRLDGITFPKWRNESIKAGGNAVVPEVVYQIFKAIEQYESLN